MGEQGPFSYGTEPAWEEKGKGCGQKTEKGEENFKFELALQAIKKIDLAR